LQRPDASMTVGGMRRARTSADIAAAMGRASSNDISENGPMPPGW
jgi:hypothetical protein